MPHASFYCISFISMAEYVASDITILIYTSATGPTDDLRAIRVPLVRGAGREQQRGSRRAFSGVPGRAVWPARVQIFRRWKR